MIGMWKTLYLKETGPMFVFSSYFGDRQFSTLRMGEALKNAENNKQTAKHKQYKCSNNLLSLNFYQTDLTQPTVSKALAATCNYIFKWIEKFAGKQAQGISERNHISRAPSLDIDQIK